MIEIANRLLALDPLLEPVLMRVHAAQGRRAIALRQYQRCVDARRRELLVEPEADTRQLYRDILAERSASTRGDDGHRRPEGGSRASSVAETAAAPPLISRHRELSRLWHALATARSGQVRVVAVLADAGIER